MTNNLKSGERLDDLQLNGLQIIQDPERFCFGIDAVMLSDFARVKPGEKVLDLGTGTGILPILLSEKTRGEHFIGLEIQKESADMARRSVEWNHLQEKIEIVQGDIKEAAALFKPTFFDVIVTNPPYMLNQHGLQNPGDAKRADIGIAMGGLGSDAAIEAADVVIMTDEPSKIAAAMRISRKTLGIVKQNIVFALGVKILVLILAAFGIANMWLAVFADVGVAVIAILNAMRAMQVKGID